MGGGWTWLLIDVVGVALLGTFLLYGQRQSARWRGVRTSTTAKTLVVAGTVCAAALSLYLLFDASRRVYNLGPGSQAPGDEALPTTPTKQEVAQSKRAGEPAKEATCQTTPGARQAGMRHEDCVFVASQIPVLASNTGEAPRTDKTVPSPGLGPGSEVPRDVGELKPLPASVMERLPALQGYRYFLAGQDIVVVGTDNRIAFVVDVRVRP